MAKPKPSDILFWFLAGLTMALLLTFVLVLVGAIPVESSDSAAAAPEPAPSRATTVTREPANGAATTAATSTLPSKTTTQESPAAPTAQLTNVVITAARGACWIQARLGSETGELLDERLLSQGQSISLRGRRVWLSVGASGNVDVRVNGKPRQLPAGTIAVVLGPTV